MKERRTALLGERSVQSGHTGPLQHEQCVVLLLETEQGQYEQKYIQTKTKESAMKHEPELAQQHPPQHATASWQQLQPTRTQQSPPQTASVRA